MKQLLHFITIGVNDLNAMKKFYMEKFGWKLLKDSDGVVFIKLNGFILSLFAKNELAEDAGVSGEGGGFRGFSLSINFNSEKEVDEAVAELMKKGVLVVKKPEKVFWGGYRSYIEDVEHNLWELAYNPFLKLDGKGNVSGHD